MTSVPKPEPCTCAPCLLATYAEAVEALERIAKKKPFDAFAGGKAADRVARVLEDLRQAGDIARKTREEDEKPKLRTDVPGFDGETHGLEVVAEALSELVPLFPPGARLTLVARWEAGKTVLVSEDEEQVMGIIRNALDGVSYVARPARREERWQ